MGQTNPEIATSMGLTRNTVKTYLQRTREKLGARNRMEASLRARQAGLLLAPARAACGGTGRERPLR
jgi:two-component system, NarL family, nitrate/nitrite response regulator NarL